MNYMNKPVTVNNKMTHRDTNEWVLLVDHDQDSAIIETVVDINIPSSTESGYTSEDALADDILGETFDYEKAQTQAMIRTTPTLPSYSLQSYLAVLLIANVLVLVAYVSWRGRSMLPSA